MDTTCAVTDGDGSQMLRRQMRTETMSNGDGYNLCSNGWGLKSGAAETDEDGNHVR